MVAPLITFPYVARVLGPEGIGIANFANSFVQYFILFSALGIPIYGMREIAKVQDDRQNRSKILIELVLLRVATTILVLIPYMLMVLTIPKLKIDIGFFLFGIIYIISNAFELGFYYSGTENFKYITIRSVVLQLIQIASLFIFIRKPTDSLLYFVLPIAINIITIIINFTYVQRFVDLRLPFHQLSLRRHFKPVLIIFSYTSAISLYLLLDTVILGFLTDKRIVGFYTAALRIVKIPLGIVAVLFPVLMPRLSNIIEKKNYNEINLLLEKSLKFITTFAVPMTVGILAIAPEIIRVLAGSGFTNSIVTIRLLCPIIIIAGLTSIYGLQTLIPFSKDILFLIAVLSGGIISVCTNFLLIPKFQENGAAIANLLAESVVLILCYLFAKNLIKIKFPTLDLLINVLISIPFFFITYCAIAH